MMNVKEAKPEFATSKTFVWWDMDTCPLPNGYDPSRVGPRIDTELKNLGYNGPLTIIGVGNLRGVPHDFLKELSSGGVVIKQPSLGSNMIDCVIDALYLNKPPCEPPVSMMLITAVPGEVLEDVVCAFYNGGSSYNLLLAFPYATEHADPVPSSLLVDNFGGEWIWDRSGLLKDLGPAYNVTRRQDTGCEIHCCALCDFSSPSFEAFAIHLNTRSHADHMDKYIAYLAERFNWDLEISEATDPDESYLAKVKAKRREFVRFDNCYRDDSSDDDTPNTIKPKRRLKMQSMGKKIKFALLCKSSSLKKKAKKILKSKKVGDCRRS